MHSSTVPSPQVDTPDPGNLFADWGIPMLLSIRRRSWMPGTTVAGGWEVRSGREGAKAIAVGSFVGMISPFRAVLGSERNVRHKIEQTVRAFRFAMLCVGVRSISERQRVRNFERTHQ